ncbi:CGNR zinc finger domain-containing protein [Kribbella monticola]|uniref:CGNR zinc finger domain-containing protein n=1 Tax=Kribbella monticola TaxID=2185285 RepID=UPI000DD4BC6E|nr:CGNR zinc finger domain-containing protein [Kribbella monticola]
MSNMVRSDDELLLELLNSAPIVDGVPTDALRGSGASGWLRERGIPGPAAAAREVRDAVADVVRGEVSAASLGRFLRDVRQVPVVSADGVRWRLEGARFPARAVLAWAEVKDRLRPCENDAECRLFLIDRSKANVRRWCSMSTCGNRLKARRHQARLHD